MLAPLTDSNGIINWDHGSLGTWHDDPVVTRGAFGPRDGVLDVTNPPFSADNSGATDATDALQAALDFCRENYLSPWLPAGQYMVTRSLKLTQMPRLASIGSAQLNLSSNFCPQRFTTWALRGEVTSSDTAAPSPITAASTLSARPGRATLVVPAYTSAFALRHDSQPSSPVAVINCSCINANGLLEPNILMAMIVQSIDVIIGPGNPAAVGVRMRGAQGSSLEDITVMAAPDAFAGIAGASGSGGAHSNITVIGARIGFDARETQPSASASNIRLINQSCAALIHEGLETLTLAGVHVVVGSASEPGAPAFSTGTPGLPLPGLPTTGRCASLLSPATGVSQLSAIAGALSVVDATFECVGCSPGHAAVASRRNLYLRRTTLAGLATVAQIFDASNRTAAIYELPAPAGHAGTTDVHELSIPVPVNPPAINSTAFIDGLPVSPAEQHGPVLLNMTASPRGKPPGYFDAVCDRHGWGDNLEFPTAAGGTHKMVNVRDHGAAGDGIHDDTEVRLPSRLVSLLPPAHCVSASANRR